MPYDLTEPLVIGISTRALFDLEKENAIFEKDGARAFATYQKEHEGDILQPGSAFELVKAFLRINELSEDKKRLVEVIVTSRNSPDARLRVFNSIEKFGLDISRCVLTSGAPISPYLKAFKTDLFLSASEDDVKRAVDDGIAAGLIVTGQTHAEHQIQQIRIAFDGDAVLFSAQAERIYQQKGMKDFMDHEREHADEPLPMGPFANFLKTLSNLQNMFATREESPIRTALVTSRNAPAHKRVIKTLRDWNVRVDEAFFLGGVTKKEFLSAFGAHIFFDDQDTHTQPASEVVASARVPYRTGDNPKDS